MSKQCMPRTETAGIRMPPEIAARSQLGTTSTDNHALPAAFEDNFVTPLRIASSTLAQLGALFRQLVIELDARDFATADRHRLKHLADLGAHVAEDASNLADCHDERHDRERILAILISAGGAR